MKITGPIRIFRWILSAIQPVHRTSVSDPEQIDVDFYLIVPDSLEQSEIKDYYHYVTDGTVTERRVTEAYHNLCSTALQTMLQKEADCHFTVWMSEPEDGWEINKDYDIRRLAADCGKLDISLRRYDNDAQAHAEALLEIRQVMDNAQLPFAAIDFRILRPTGTPDKDKSPAYYLWDFPYEEIYAENLAERLVQWAETHDK